MGGKESKQGKVDVGDVSKTTPEHANLQEARKESTEERQPPEDARTLQAPCLETDPDKTSLLDNSQEIVNSAEDKEGSGEKDGNQVVGGDSSTEALEKNGMAQSLPGESEQRDSHAHFPGVQGDETTSNTPERTSTSLKGSLPQPQGCDRVPDIEPEEPKELNGSDTSLLEHTQEDEIREVFPDASSSDGNATNLVEGPKTAAPEAAPKVDAKTGKATAVPKRSSGWYFSAAGSLITLLAALFFSLLSPGAKTDLEMPSAIQDHLDHGQTLEIPVLPAGRRLRLFARSTSVNKPRASVLLLPGFCATSYSFHSVMESLAAAGIQSAVIDFPGSGLSDKPLEDDSANAVYGVTEQASMLTPVLDSLAYDLVHIVAHDTAGTSAVLWCAQNPNRVASLTLINTVTDPPFSPAFPTWVLPPLALLPGLSRTVSHPSILRTLLRLCCAISLPDPDAEALAYLLFRGEGARAASLALTRSGLSAATAAHVHSAAELELGKVPRQLVWAQSWREQGEEALSQWPLADLSLLSCSRWPQVDCPEELALQLERFVLAHASAVTQSKEGHGSAYDHWVD